MGRHRRMGRGRSSRAAGCTRSRTRTRSRLDPPRLSDRQLSSTEPAQDTAYLATGGRELPAAIPRKLDADAVEKTLAELRERIAALETENERFRSERPRTGGP